MSNAILHRIRAHDLQVGDTVITDGAIDLPVAEVRPILHGFVTARYEIVAGSGWRIFGAIQTLTVMRPAEQEAH